MLRPQVQHSLKNAEAYFREHLCVGDYYSAGRKITGEWIGRGAEKLGLKGVVQQADFLALCEGRNPTSGGRLTQRLMSPGREGDKRTLCRRIFYDFTISPPKSVSVVALYQDDRIVGLHNRAISLALAELEKFAETRVRTARSNGERVTANAVTACFRHDTSRELDPHLHTHCVVFNATFDAVEDRWKALHASGMYRAQKFVENVYFHHLCQGLRSLGYEVANNRVNFEIGGVPKEVIARFSKRRQQIDEEAAKRIKREGLHGNAAEVRNQVARDKRRRKMRDSTADRLRSAWSAQLTPEERGALARLRLSSPDRPPAADVAGIVAWADQHLFERKAVIQDYELWSAALARGRGTDLDLPGILAEMARRGYLREAGSRRITSPEVMGCEMAVVLAARKGRNWFAPLNAGYAPAAALSDEQRAAVGQILKSQDFITLFRGGAGTGKSFALRDVSQGLGEAGHPVVVLAPQRQQAAGLQADGLPAETIARCLQAKAVPPGAVVIVDEAGQIGARQMSQLVSLVQAQGGRLILSGDTRQHGAVEASDALLAIERYSGSRPATIRWIRRQDPALAKSGAERRFIAGYRAAVKAAAAGRIGESFTRLDRLGCIRETGSDARCAELAGEYLESVGRHERALVVAQTWADVNRLNAAIRAELAATGLLGPSVPLKTYQAVDLDRAQKRDYRYYDEGRVAYFLQGYGRFSRGDLCRIVGAGERGIVLLKNGRRSTMSYDWTDRLVVAAEREIEIAPGDRLQLKFNGRSSDGHPIANGELVTVRRIGSDGSLVVEGDAGPAKTLAPEQRLFNQGYAVTSYASQGKTVDTVLVSDSGCRAMADSRHWYVAISRARKRVRIFTEDKAALRANIEAGGGRELALDLALGLPKHPGCDDLPRWGERARAITERTRLHDQVMQRTQGHAERRRIAP